MSISLSSSNSVSYISNYEVAATAAVGDNATTAGPTECSLERANSTPVTCHNLWSADTSTGLDSGWRDLSLSVPQGGGTDATEFSVADAETDPLTVSTAAHGSVSVVKIRAGVSAGGTSAAIRSVAVQFYKNGVLQDQEGYTSEFAADAMELDDPVEREQLLTVTPAHTDNDSVTVTLQLRLQALEGIEPDPVAVFGQIFVFTA